MREPRRSLSFRATVGRLIAYFYEAYRNEIDDFDQWLESSNRVFHSQVQKSKNVDA